ncbi:hypothetical protein HQ531_13985 [bacterium]|nr:hypothetical protein [bacterium]
MIVIVIIGVLAAVSVAVYSSNIQKAKRTEADAALGSISLYIDIHYAEFGRYPKERPADYVIGASWNYIKPGELNGKYFSDSSYTYEGPPNGKWFKIICAKGTVLDFDRTFDQDGVFQDELYY